jgi:hypothetical protein
MEHSGKLDQLLRVYEGFDPAMLALIGKEDLEILKV